MLLDSNLIIYAARPEHASLRTFIAEEVPSVSVVSKVETLGYHRLSGDEKSFLEEFFGAADVLSVSQSVIREAIQLRQRRSMSLGDALIAGTALAYDLRLGTHNATDFAWIEEMDIVDPFAADQ